MRTLLALIIALLAFSHEAEAFRLRLNGMVTDHGTQQPLASARVRIYKDGVIQRVLITNGAGKYSISLENQGAYVIRVDAPGHQGKCITVDTHGMEWEGDGRTSNLEIEMRLPAFRDGIDLSFFDLPLGMAYFEPATGLTRWSVKYERSITADVLELMADYDQHYPGLLQPTAGIRTELSSYLVLHGR
ncbi:MAG: carboxypeptidase-like regulatory domain-containing protein [Flavobacteriales bacterium]|nr:carboxypeptidase regulatory-like domain-containing protein [Flavobacteriales bacterium]